MAYLFCNKNIFIRTLLFLAFNMIFFPAFVTSTQPYKNGSLSESVWMLTPYLLLNFKKWTGNGFNLQNGIS